MKVKISEIIVTEDRQRAGIGEGREAQRRLDELAVSIARRLLHPIVLRDDMTLVAGFRRLSAAKLNGWTEIEARLESDMSDLEREEMELEENINRLDLSWQERDRAIARLHAFRIRQNPQHSQAATAAELGKDQMHVSQAVLVTKMAEAFPEILTAKSHNKAMAMAHRIADAKLRTYAVGLDPQTYEDIEDRLVLGDAVEIIKAIPDESFRLILTDPPFGIDYNEKIASHAQVVTTYLDDATRYRHIMSMFSDLYRVLMPDGFLIWFCGFSWYEQCKYELNEVGFTVDEVPDVWVRAESKCFTSNPNQLFPKGYDIALHCYKGKPIAPKRRPSNVFAYPLPNDTEQSVERPWELYADFIDHLTVKGEPIADFFMGSGSVAIAAERLGRDWYGCELNPDRRSRAITKIKAHRPDGIK